MPIAATPVGDEPAGFVTISSVLSTPPSRTLRSSSTEPPQRYLEMRRIFECAFIILSAPIVLPLCALAAITVRASSAGPILYRQRRPGMGSSVFIALKFRTMYSEDCGDGSRLTKKEDQRITALGRYLRLTHLDELPQLWNVLRGQMSLIGPRPEPLPHVQRIEEVLPSYRERRVIRPGLTGWAQVHIGYTDDLDGARRKLVLDRYYIAHASPRLDALIMLKTVLRVITGKGR